MNFFFYIWVGLMSQPSSS